MRLTICFISDRNASKMPKMLEKKKKKKKKPVLAIKTQPNSGQRGVQFTPWHKGCLLNEQPNERMCELGSNEF